jgi:hypothetical protein
VTTSSILIKPPTQYLAQGVVSKETEQATTQKLLATSPIKLIQKAQIQTELAKS